MREIVNKAPNLATTLHRFVAARPVERLDRANKLLKDQT
jgi:hypothetical protein